MAIISGNMGSGSGLANLMNLYKSYQSLMGGQGPDKTGQNGTTNTADYNGAASDAGETTDNGASDNGAMGQRAQSGQAGNIHGMVQNALGVLNDKNLPLSFNDRMSMVEPLLRFQYFGYGGGLNQGQIGNTQANTVNTGNLGNNGMKNAGGIAGIISSAGAAAA